MAALMAGTGMTVINPREPLPMGAHGGSLETAWLHPVRHTGVHDDLNARALALSDGQTTLVMATVDLLAIFSDDVFKIRDHVQTKTGRNDLHILVAAIHTHHGPDTYGVYGGVPRSYRDFLHERTAEAIISAVQGLRPARIGFATSRIEGIASNIRIPGNETTTDPVLGVVHVVGQDGSTLAALVNFALHADVVSAENTLLTADFVGFLRQRLEEALGGMGLFLNGAQGDIYPVHRTTDDKGSKGLRTFEEAERVGKTLAEAALAILPRGDALTENAPIVIKKRTLDVPLDNWPLYIFKILGVVKRKSYWGKLRTEIWNMRIGEAQFITMPGQAFHDIGLKIKERMDGRYKFVIGLANDEIFYIVPPWRWKKEVGYEEGASLGPRTWPLLEAAIPW